MNLQNFFNPFTLFRITKDICMDLRALLRVYHDNKNRELDKTTQITNLVKTS